MQRLRLIKYGANGRTFEGASGRDYDGGLLMLEHYTAQGLLDAYIDHDDEFHVGVGRAVRVDCLPALAERCDADDRPHTAP